MMSYDKEYIMNIIEILLMLYRWKNDGWEVHP